MALSLGNAAYASLDSLDNAANDANDMAVALESLGFEVFKGLDLTRAETETMLAAFSEAAKSADVALFFYAGHAFQIEGRNYLLPVDARMRSMDDVFSQSMELDRFLTAVTTTGGISVIILDACRNNPLEGVEDAPQDSLRDGLAEIGKVANVFTAYSTQPDNVAYDGLDRNSFFTEALLNHIHTPGQTISDLMISVRRDVISATGGQQVPFDNSSLTDQFRFDTRPASASTETMLWQMAAKSQDEELAQLYLDRYPNGAHSGDARALVSNLTPDAETAALIEEGDEDTLWNLAQRTRSRRLLDVYIAQYPGGRFVRQAQALLATLPDETAQSPTRRCERLATHPRDATAGVAGVSMAVLQANAAQAVAACREAVAAFPQLARYKGHLARALVASGDMAAALTLYEEAAAAGDMRAMVSLGLIHETGNWVPVDTAKALEFYEKAAFRGHPDGAINLAVALFEGQIVARDPQRAVDLLRRASAVGSPIATFNLGVLAQQGVVGTPDQALEFYRAAARGGQVKGHLAAAILLDQGVGVAPDYRAAAVELLRGVAADEGQSLEQLTLNAQGWNRETIRAIQAVLAAAALYPGALDGIPGPKFRAGLEAWRNGGFDAGALVGG